MSATTSTKHDRAFVLDRINWYYLSRDNAGRYFNELKSLDYLGQGLHFLYTNVKSVEEEVARRMPPAQRVFSFGNDPMMAGVPQGLVACCFHWYAVSVCNYVKMVGWLWHEVNPSSTPANEYVKSVVPDAKKWRDKVAAHFSRHTPHDSDTPADRMASVFFPVGYDGDAFYASPMTLTMTRSGKQYSSRSLPRWSLTKLHERLRPRYWPDD